MDTWATDEVRRRGRITTGNAVEIPTTLWNHLHDEYLRLAELEADLAAHPCGCLACVRERQAAQIATDALLAVVYAIDDRVIGIRRRGGKET